MPDGNQIKEIEKLVLHILADFREIFSHISPIEKSTV
jgi:hypothetical protein